MVLNQSNSLVSILTMMVSELFTGTKHHAENMLDMMKSTVETLSDVLLESVSHLERRASRDSANRCPNSDHLTTSISQAQSRADKRIILSECSALEVRSMCFRHA